jgi:hypothetical protein
MQPSRTCTRRSLPIHSYQHGAPLSRGAWKRRGDFDRMNRYQLIDILIEEDNPGWTLFSFAMCWLDARVIDGRGNCMNDETGLTESQGSSLSWWRILIDWQTEPIRINKKHGMRYAAAKFPIANYLTRWREGPPTQARNPCWVNNHREGHRQARSRPAPCIYRLGKSPLYRVPFQTSASFNIPTIKKVGASKLD